MGWEVGGRIKGKGTYVFLWLIHVDILQKLLLRNNFPLKKKKKEIILQIKVKFLKRQKEKNKYHIVTYICGI